MSTLRFFARYARSYTGWLTVACIAVPLYSIASAAMVTLIEPIFDEVLLAGNAAPSPGDTGGDAAAESPRESAVPSWLDLKSKAHDGYESLKRRLGIAPQSVVWFVPALFIVVYIVLGILYESYVHPLTILSTLPSAGVGALLALLLFKTELTLIALIGIVLLIGIVKKNAIMMIDFALDAERKEGKGPAEAIYEACLLRFRPIMMTTMAALFGAMPLALGTGVGSELRRPLGIAIVGGLIVSQLLTLYTTPVVYLYLDRFRWWVLRQRARVVQRPA